ncbi:MSLNL protein, partial [Chloroceryle aenea]|nr:MSLNL protein [Chloroceryle aenea]
PQHSLSASVPQGFQCIPASDLPAADILAFARSLQNKTAELSSAQLSCLARLLAAKNLTDDFSSYPPDLLLFLDLAKVHNGTCREFYTRASRGNLALLPRGSARRTGLLRGALTCLGVRSSCLHPEQLSSLGALVCDMEPESITASDPSILENLKLCPALTGTQQDALNAVLLGGGTVYGDPSSWDLRILQNLGPLVLALNQTTLSLVAKGAREAFGRSIAATYGSQGHSQREKTLTLLRAFAGPSASSHPRLKRSTDRCPSMPVTASIISDPLFLIFYQNSEQFELCLSNEVLKANLEPLVNQPLTTEFLLVIKKKLEQIYPMGMPEEQLRLLGPLSRLYTAEEISSWLVTSSDTLSALLKPADGKWEAPQVQQLLSRYLALGGSFTGPLLREMGGENLCNLQEEQIEQIPPEAIRTAGQPNISSCSQTKKNQLYRKAQEAFAGQAGTIRAYYCQIWPYLGGAPVSDLKDLAGAGTAIDMDMDTFLALNPKELLVCPQGAAAVSQGPAADPIPGFLPFGSSWSLCSWRSSPWRCRCESKGRWGWGRVEPSPAGTATTPPCPTASTSITPTATVPAPTTLPAVPTPVDGGSRPTTHSSTSSAKVPPPPKSTRP